LFFAVCCRKFFILENLQTAGIIAFPGAVYGQAAPCLLKYRRLSKPLKAQNSGFGTGSPLYRVWKNGANEL
jgi:hypothetical protein